MSLYTRSPRGSARLLGAPRTPSSPPRFQVPVRTRVRPIIFLVVAVIVTLFLWRDDFFSVPGQLEPTRTPAPEIKGRPAKQRKAQPREDFVEVDGLLYTARVNPALPELHPILYLIRQAKAAWTDKVARQSKTLEEAVVEYRRRYNRRPPKGFDKWFAFAQKNKVILVDEYDQINRDLEPFLGLPTELLQSRSQSLVNDGDNYYHNGAYTIHVRKGDIERMSGPFAEEGRASDQVAMMSNFVQWLPDMDITTWLHDTPVIHTAGENKVRYVELARAGKTLPRAEWDDAYDRADFVGWESFCPPRSNLRKNMAGTDVGDPPSSRSFIVDHVIAMEICRHPSILNLHSLTSNYGLGPRAVPFWPLFSHSKTPMYSDILIAPVEQYGADVGQDPSWSEKRDDRMLWRGSTTGSRYDRATLWRPSQRSRLNMLTNTREGTRNVLVADAHSGAQKLLPEISMGGLNDALFDVAFTGQPLQCHEGDGTCDALKRTYRFAGHMGPDEANEYKYVMDVDGNGWSGRFHRLMSTRSVVLKATAFIEWYADRIQPWVHYVPVKLDYSDLHHIMTFFLGWNGADGHDNLGREIGEAGKQWAEQHWRYEDMEVYMLRLYLEYARVMGPRDGSGDYVG